VSFVGTPAPSSELHQGKEMSSQQPDTRAAQKICGVQLGVVRTFTMHTTLI